MSNISIQEMLGYLPASHQAYVALFFLFSNFFSVFRISIYIYILIFGSRISLSLCYFTKRKSQAKKKKTIQIPESSVVTPFSCRKSHHFYRQKSPFFSWTPSRSRWTLSHFSQEKVSIFVRKSLPRRILSLFIEKGLHFLQEMSPPPENLSLAGKALSR
jgi:hypothetical protein